MVQVIVDRFRPQKIVLFGSYASGRPSEHSDLDLLIIMESDLPKHRRAAPIRMLLRPTPCPMDILVYTPWEVEHWRGTANHIITEALSSGRVLYERT